MEKIFRCRKQMKQRDIVLVPFPFSNFSGNKIRPALILSNNSYNNASEDVIICGITSNLKNPKYSLIIDHNNLETGQLDIKSAIKAENVLKINKSLIIKDFATIDKQTFSKVIKILQELFSLD